MRLPERKLYRYKFGTGDYDEREQLLRIDGRLVKIRPQQRQLLSTFLRAPGKALAWEDLWDAVWGAVPGGEVDRDQHAVAEAVSRLRANLGAHRDLIKTEPKVGYRFLGDIRSEEIYRESITSLDLKPGQLVPRQATYKLVKRFTGAGDIEVWLAEDALSGKLRVFKLSAMRDSLAELKREYYLTRAAVRKLGKREDLVAAVSLDIEELPYVLEIEYGGVDLSEWVKVSSRFMALSLDQRLALFIKIADAVAALHTVPIFHGDLKPSNVLVTEADGEVDIRIIDFASSRHPDPKALAEVATATVSPASDLLADSWRSTLLYMAPERRAGATPSEAADVYALGVLLKQFAAGQLTAGIETGWEQGCHYPLLATDIARAISAEPSLRHNHVHELVRDVRDIRSRSAQLAASERQAEALRRMRQRRPWALALTATLAAALIVASVLYAQVARTQRELAQQLAVVKAVNRLFVDDFIRLADPAVSGRRDVTVAAAAIQAAGKIDEEFGGLGQDARAALHAAMLKSLVGLQEYTSAIEPGRKALGLLQRIPSPEPLGLLDVRLDLARALMGVGRLNEASAQLDSFDPEQQALGKVPDDFAVRASVMRSMIASDRNDTAAALAYARQAARTASNATHPVAAGLQELVLGRLGDAERLAGAFSAAEARLRELLTLQSARLGPADWRPCTTAVGLSNTLLAQHRLAEAEALLTPAEACLTAALGPGNPRSLFALRIRGNLRYEQARYREAAAIRAETARRAAVFAGSRSMMVLSELANQADALSLAGDGAACEPLAADVLAGFKAANMGNEPAVQSLSYLLASCRLDQHKITGVAQLLSGLSPDVLQQAEPAPAWKARLSYERGRLAWEEGNTAVARVHLAEAAQLMGQPQEVADPGFASRIRRMLVAAQKKRRG